MKKISVAGLAVGVIAISLPFLALAQVNQPLPPPPAGNLQDGQLPPPFEQDQQQANTPTSSFRQQISDGIRNNENARNLMLRGRPEYSSSSDQFSSDQFPSDQLPPRDLSMASSTEFASSTDFGSTTRQNFATGTRDMMPRGERRGPRNFQDLKNQDLQNGDRKALRIDMFNRERGHVVSQMQVALDNLKNIRERIASRITKVAATGVDVTDTNTLLTTADMKIATAQTAIDTLSAFTPTTTPTTSGDQASSTEASDTATSTTIGLDKPRQISNSAIQAVKDARDALNLVVQSIAHDLGVNLK